MARWLICCHSYSQDGNGETITFFWSTGLEDSLGFEGHAIIGEGGSVPTLSSVSVVEDHYNYFFGCITWSRLAF